MKTTTTEFEGKATAEDEAQAGGRIFDAILFVLIWTFTFWIWLREMFRQK